MSDRRPKRKSAKAKAATKRLMVMIAKKRIALNVGYGSWRGAAHKRVPDGRNRADAERDAKRAADWLVKDYKPSDNVDDAAISARERVSRRHKRQGDAFNQHMKRERDRVYEGRTLDEQVTAEDRRQRDERKRLLDEYLTRPDVSPKKTAWLRNKGSRFYANAWLAWWATYWLSEHRRIDGRSHQKGAAVVAGVFKQLTRRSTSRDKMRRARQWIDEFEAEGGPWYEIAARRDEIDSKRWGAFLVERAGRADD